MNIEARILKLEAGHAPRIRDPAAFVKRMQALKRGDLVRISSADLLLFIWLLDTDGEFDYAAALASEASVHNVIPWPPRWPRGLCADVVT